jgi:hypothetical protein
MPVELIGGPLDGQTMILDAVLAHHPMLEMGKGAHRYRLDPQRSVFVYVGTAKRTTWRQPWAEAGPKATKQ